MLEAVFRLEERGSTPWKETVAGVTTFLTMSYVIFVHPDILAQAGMDREALITVTILASAVGTILAGLWANVPIAMAPGMGLNAFFALTLVRGDGVTWETALGVVFISGVIFFFLTVFGIRTKIVNAIPVSLRLAIASGIGLFITLIGLQNLGLIVDDPVSLITAGSLTTPVLLGLVGFLVMAGLEARGVEGSILLGILLTTALGVLYVEDVSLPTSLVSAPPSPAPLLLKLDVAGAFTWGLWGAILSFMFIDLFDSVGTIMACAYEGGMVEEDGTIQDIDRILEADATATIIGSLLGTSTTTAYVESGSGIALGGRTGLANLVTALCFLLALVVTPLIGIVPSFATAPALILVGVYMFRNVSQIDWGRLDVAVPAFLTIILMPLTYSISTGLAFGFISHVLLAVVEGKGREIHLVMWIIAFLSALELSVTLLP